MNYSPFDGLRMPRDLVCDFFALFSRFEYSLKQAGFCRGHRGLATPAWRSFSENAGNQMYLEPGSQASEAVDFLNAEPPQVGVPRRNRRKFRHPNSSPARSVSKSINLPPLWNV